ncbi:MAG: hypothetical protein PHR43_02950 [Dehalococcoidales bacterium]|nr:hypothetical protein [Dehalococcoidales bacterium]
MEREICGSNELDLAVGAGGGVAPETDLPPEFCRYHDEGCELARSCLNCPFPKCFLDTPGGPQHWRKELRDSEIVRLFYQEHKTVRELTRRFGVGVRTVQRAIKKVRQLKASEDGK